MMKFSLSALALAAGLATGARAADPGAFLVGQFAAHHGDIALAATKMQQALAAEPDNADLRANAFVLALMADRADAASLARTVPDDPVAALLLATLAAREGNWKGAELQFAELPPTPLTDGLKPLLQAWALQAQGRTERAMNTLQPALNSGKLGAVAPLHAALLADAAHRDGLAQRLYDDLARAEGQPTLQFAQILASWQARSGNMAAAGATIDSALKATPDLAIAGPGLHAALATAAPPDAATGLENAFVQVAAGLRGAEGHHVGTLLVHLALALDPAMVDAHLLAAEIASSDKQYGLAAHELERISPAAPLWPVVQLRLAALYQRQGQDDAALARLRALAAAFPDQPGPLVQTGDTLQDEKKFPEAVQAYDRAIAMLRHPAASDWTVFYARGAALERIHEWPRAEADMNRALELSPDEPFVLNFLGYAMAERRENLALAQAMIEKAMAARPNDGAIVDSLGWVKLQQGETKEALRLLEKAAEMEPEDPSITGHLGDAYWSLGRRVEAADQWRRALVLKPDPDDRERIEARLKSAGQ